MKIELFSLDDACEFASLVEAAKRGGWTAPARTVSSWLDKERAVVADTLGVPERSLRPPPESYEVPLPNEPYVAQVPIENPDEPRPAEIRVDVDSRGFAWDARIHSSARSKNQNGTWKARRGVDSALVARVEAELATSAGVLEKCAITAEDIAPRESSNVGGAFAPELASAPVEVRDGLSGAEDEDLDEVSDEDLEQIVASCDEARTHEMRTLGNTLAIAKDFINRNDTASFNRVKAAAVPDGSENGKPLQTMTGTERSFLCQCLRGYDEHFVSLVEGL